MSGVVLSEHGADALKALISQLPDKSVVVEVGRSGWQVTVLIAMAIRDSGKDMEFYSIADNASHDLFTRLHNEEVEDYVKLIAADPEDAAEEFGRESVDAAFIHSRPQNIMIRNIWAWSEKIRLNGLLCGGWDDLSRLAIMKETKGAFTRVGFDLSLWKIPLYYNR